MCNDREEQYDCLSITSPYSRDQRVLCITGTLPHVLERDYGKIHDLMFKLIQLDREHPGEPIVLVINGPGGSADALGVILNTISSLHSPVYTVVTDIASSASACLFISGTKGHRYIFRNGRLLLHLSWLFESPKSMRWKFWKKEDDTNQFLQKYNKLLAKIILDCSNVKELLTRLGDWYDVNDPAELTRGILTLLGKDQVFNAEEAVRCGLADKIIGQEEFDILFR